MRCRPLAIASRSTADCSARTGQQSVGPGGSQHLHGLLCGDRRQVEGHVLHDLDEDAAETEHQHRSELGIPGHSQNHLAAPLAHLLHVSATDPGFRHAAGRSEHHQVEGVPDLLGRGQVEPHTADVRLVDDVRRDDLHHHRIADLIGSLDGLARRFAETAVRNGEVVGPQDFLAFHFTDLIELHSSVPPDHPFDSASIDGETGYDPGRSVAPGSVVRHPPECPDGPLRGWIARDVQRRQNAPRLFHSVTTHERRHKRFLAVMGCGQPIRQLHRPGHVLGRRDQQDRIAEITGLDRLERGHVAVRIRVADDIDRIAHCSLGRQRRSQGLLRDSIRRRQVAAPSLPPHPRP